MSANLQLSDAVLFRDPFFPVLLLNAQLYLPSGLFDGVCPRCTHQMCTAQWKEYLSWLGFVLTVDSMLGKETII